MTTKNYNVPRVLIGATGSGSGKTTITCGILKAFKNLNKNLRAFKCGPDYIDPMFHTKVLGIQSTNLDLFFNDKDTIKYLLDENTLDENENRCDIAIMEGVMGYYDGVAGITFTAGAYDLAKSTDTPAILVVDCKGKSVSIVAEIKGYLDYVSDSNIKGVILNRISPMMYNDIKKMIQNRLNINVFGYMPAMSDIGLESRHLGLVTADEIGNLEEIIDKIASQVEKSIDLHGIYNLAQMAPELTYEEKFQIAKGEPVKIAVAKDNAFCFYYKDNLKLLKKLGAKLEYFSPVAGETIPEGTCGMAFGGGYPELYLRELSQNKVLAEDIKNAIKDGMPVIAECGGFMYLHEWIESEDGKRFNMVGALKGGCYPLKKLGRFGYIDVEFREDNMLGKKGGTFKAHEFHYWDSENPGTIAHASKPLRKRNWDCMISYKNLVAGYPHIHYYSNLNIPKNFVEECVNFKKHNDIY